jgi:hypothetical protein
MRHDAQHGGIGAVAIGRRQATELLRATVVDIIKEVCYNQGTPYGTVLLA